MSSKPPKEPKPPKEKKVYYSSRGGAGRSKSATPATRKPMVSSAPSRMIEVPVPMNKTTTIGRGGGGNGRTFVVEEGVFEQVMTHEVAKIKAMKDAEGKRKTVSLRGGAVIPKKEAKDDKSQTSTQSSRGDYDDHSSTKSIVSRFPRVPSFNSSLFSRGRPVSPVSHIGSGGSESIASNGYQSTSNGRHCSTCQCWRHTTSTQASLDIPPTPTTPSSPSFRSVFPGVLLYVPGTEETHTSGPPSSPTTSLPYYRDRFTASPEPRVAPTAS